MSRVGASAALVALILGSLAGGSCASRHTEHWTRYELRLGPQSGTATVSKIEGVTRILDEPSLFDQINFLRWAPVRIGPETSDVVRETDFSLDPASCRYSAARPRAERPAPSSGSPAAVRPSGWEHPGWAIRIVRTNDSTGCRGSVNIVQRDSGETRTAVLPRCPDGYERWLADSSFLILSLTSAESVVIDARSAHAALVPAEAARGALIGTTLYYAGDAPDERGRLMAVEVDTGTRRTAVDAFGGRIDDLTFDPVSRHVLYLGQSTRGPSIFAYDHANGRLSDCGVPAGSARGRTSLF